MNRADAKRIAETVTNDQLKAMFDSAKVGITDWRKPSAVNPCISKGKSWNIMRRLDVAELKRGRRDMLIIKNMVLEFGDFLDDEIKPAKQRASRPAIQVRHEDPVFEVLP